MILKINSLFKNFNTMSFLDLLVNYENLKDNGYNQIFNSKLSFFNNFAFLPFFNDWFSFDFYNE